MVHHDIWDYDVPAPPNLISVRRDGKDIAAVAQLTKMGFVFILDRLTGKPLFPAEERPVPQSQVPGEATWPTQPFPVRPPPLARISVTLDDITTVTPESRKYCLDNFGASLPGRIFNPWGLREMTVEMPGTLGGGNWSGSSFNPSLGYLFVNVNEVGAVGLMKPQPAGSAEAYVRSSNWEHTRASGTTIIIRASSLRGASSMQSIWRPEKSPGRCPWELWMISKHEGFPKLAFIA